MLELFCFLIWILVTRVCLVCSHTVGCSLMIYALFFTYVVINGFKTQDKNYCEGSEKGRTVSEGFQDAGAWPNGLEAMEKWKERDVQVKCINMSKNAEVKMHNAYSRHIRRKKGGGIVAPNTSLVP